MDLKFSFYIELKLFLVLLINVYRVCYFQIKIQLYTFEKNERIE